MGKDLYEYFPAAKRVYDRAAELLDFDILSVCFEGPAAKLSQTRYSQPAIFVTSMAAVHVLRESPAWSRFNVRFSAGLSLGEATALCASGAISLDEGIRFVHDRGQYMEDAAVQNPGMMAAVLGADLKTVEAICSETGAEVGNLNAPGQIVISGFKEAVEKAIEKLRHSDSLKVIPLDVSGGFHSRCMTPASDKIQTSLQGVLIQKPQITVISNLTARPEEDTARIKENLTHQMNHRTLWEDSMRFILDSGVKSFLELGPGKVLKGLLRKIDSSATVSCLGTVDDFRSLGI